MPEVLFYRDYRRFSGGHLKVWDYYNHVRSSEKLRPRIAFSAESVWDETNPWLAERQQVLESMDVVRPALIFVAGMDWEALDAVIVRNPEVPVVNLVQSLLHARADNPRSAFLARRAVRICVSEDVQAAIAATGQVNGPLNLIPNGMERAEFPLPLPDEAKDIDLLIAAAKVPALGVKLEAVLRRPGRRIQLLTTRIPRPDFHGLVRRSRVTLFLPRTEEGFYLPALEGMALGTLVVCPDCIGNRSFCLPEVNCLRPTYKFEALRRAAESALTLGPARTGELCADADATVDRHSMAQERRLFLELLAGMGLL